MFIPRLAQGQQRLKPLLYDRGVRTTAAPLYFLGHNPELSLIPTGRPMGSVLDPSTHIRQKPWAGRAPAFRALPWGDEPEPYLPDASPLSDDEISALAIGPVNAQRGAGATLLLTTYHVAGEVGTRGRDLELLYAARGISHFRDEGMAEPPPFASVTVPREIYATIAVHVHDLRSPAARRAIADSYLELEPDGFWVKIVGFHERTRPPEDIRAAGTFLAALRGAGLPVVSCGAGQLHLAFLVNEISAAIGISEGERFTIPTTWQRTDENGRRPGRARLAYHPKYHWSFRVGSPQADKAFGQSPCECGIHPPQHPPSGALVAEHAAILRASQAAEALDGDVEERREWLLASSKMASWAAEDAEVRDSHTTAALYELLFSGLDSGGDAAAGEQAEL